MTTCIPNTSFTLVPAQRGRMASGVGATLGAFLLPGEYSSYVLITLTGLKNPSEIRVFEYGTTTEVAGSGAENVTSGSHSFNIGLGQQVDIAILSLGYQNTRILNYSSTVSASVPIQQVIDRQYENP